MPRLRKSEADTKNTPIKQLIALYQIERAVGTKEQLGKMMCMSKTTFYKRLQNPGEMTLDELRKLKSCLNIPKETMVEYIGRAL